MDEVSEPFRPPYMSFQTFWRFIEELRTKPLPPQIDRSLMRTKSGTDQANLNSALTTFRLVGPNGEVLPHFKELVQGDEGRQKDVLGALVRSYYAAALNVSAQNGTNQQLQEAFRDAYGMTGPDTRRKAVTFFLHACRQADIELSPYFPSTRAGSGAPGTPRPRKATRRRATTPPPIEETSTASPSAATVTSGDHYSVSLESGGTVSIDVNVNLFEISTEDRTFVIELVDKLRGYGVQSSPQPQMSGAL